jgi:alcohol dehydrogenase
MDVLSHGALRAPRHLVFGAGQRAVLGDHVAALGRRALIVTDARMTGDPDFAAMRAAIEAAGVGVTLFDGVEPELPLGCNTGAAAAGRGADVVVGIGGGSCLDAAKLAALLLAHGGAPADYYGEYKVPGPVAPLVAVPTTAGTGSEVTPVAVLADPERAVKIGIASPHLIPTVAICDPDLTLTCPPGLTAASGADALAHAIEAFTTLGRAPDPRLTLDHVFIGKNPICDLLALEAVRLIGRSLVRAVETGSDVAARADMMLGSTMAGLAFGTAGTAAAHAIQYPVGALTHTAHGLGVAAILPYVMAYNRPACEAGFAAIGTAIGLPAEGSRSEQAEAAITGVAALFDRIGIPADLKALGVREENLDEIGRLALGAERLIKNNPRPLTPDSMALLVRAAFDGRRDALAGQGAPA